jgi:hypothetical protein
MIGNLVLPSGSSSSEAEDLPGHEQVRQRLRLLPRQHPIESRELDQVRGPGTDVMII